MTSEPPEVPADSAPRGAPHDDGPMTHERRSVLRRLGVLVLVTCVVTVLVRVFVLGVFVVPTASMAPTLLAGDRILVNRLAYAFGGIPARGDVVVFDAGEGDGRAAYVKRVLGLPGDTIALENKVVLVNGTPVARELVGEVRLDDDGERRPDAGFGLDREIWEEQAGGRRWEIAAHKAVLARTEGPFVVPDGHVFVVGDDRDASEDSRTEGGFGPVPLSDVQGRAVRVLFSFGVRRGFRSERVLVPIR